MVTSSLTVMVMIVVCGVSGLWCSYENNYKARTSCALQVGCQRVVSNHWTGLLDWTTGVDYWTHIEPQNLIFL